MFRRCFTTTVLALAITSALQAQDRPRHARAGLWIAVGYGVARNDLKCTGCTFAGPDDAWRGGSGGGGFGAVGGTVSQQLLVGLELNISGTSDDTSSATIFLPLLVVQYYPSTFGGFHLKGGIGRPVFALGRPGGSAEAIGFAFQGGVGYDFRIGPSFSLTPYANIAGTTLGRSVIVNGNAGSITRVQNSMIAQLGLAFRWSTTRWRW